MEFEPGIKKSLVYESINEIRMKLRQRPDKNTISNHIVMKHGQAMAATLPSIDKLLEEHKIYNKKTTKGEDSFYVSEGVAKKIETNKKKQSSEDENTQETVEDLGLLILDDKHQGRLTTPKISAETISLENPLVTSTFLSSVTKMEESINLLNKLLHEE